GFGAGLRTGGLPAQGEEAPGAVQQRLLEVRDERGAVGGIGGHARRDVVVKSSDGVRRRVIGLDVARVSHLFGGGVAVERRAARGDGDLEQRQRAVERLRCRVCRVVGPVRRDAMRVDHRSGLRRIRGRYVAADIDLLDFDLILHRETAPVRRALRPRHVEPGPCHIVRVTDLLPDLLGRHVGKVGREAEELPRVACRTRVIQIAEAEKQARELILGRTRGRSPAAGDESRNQQTRAEHTGGQRRARRLSGSKAHGGNDVERLQEQRDNGWRSLSQRMLEEELSRGEKERMIDQCAEAADDWMRSHSKWKLFSSMESFRIACDDMRFLYFRNRAAMRCNRDDDYGHADEGS
ncbi:hypothetical protein CAUPRSCDRAFT_11989, partial [Caulochytrium protostelioides]